jgi:hypothetical protein
LENEIAAANGYMTQVRWYEYRRNMMLDRLHQWIEDAEGMAKGDVAAAMQAGIDLVAPGRIWHFAVDEIGRQLDRPANKLLLPDQVATEAAFFAKVAEVCAVHLVGEVVWKRRDDEA